MKSFKDHFSDDASAYSRFRPGYPDALFEYLSGLCQQHDFCWDCATGNGQAAAKLSSYFKQVVATDASQRQIAEAHACENVEYRVTSAESSGLEDSCVDLLTVAQALHWFDLQAFGQEVLRVLNPGGVLAVWTYNLLTVSPSVDAVIKDFYTESLRGYWPKERQMVENGYENVSFPMQMLQTPSFQMCREWGLEDVFGYLMTWSATRRLIQAEGKDKVNSLRDALLKNCDTDLKKMLVKWPLSLKIWKKH